jgi:hypothetical protein
MYSTFNIDTVLTSFDILEARVSDTFLDTLEVHHNLDSIWQNRGVSLVSNTVALMRYTVRRLEKSMNSDSQVFPAVFALNHVLFRPPVFAFGSYAFLSLAYKPSVGIPNRKARANAKIATCNKGIFPSRMKDVIGGQGDCEIPR